MQPQEHDQILCSQYLSCHNSCRIPDERQPEHHPSHHLSQYADPALNLQDGDSKLDLKPDIKIDLEGTTRLDKPDPYEEGEQ